MANTGYKKFLKLLKVDASNRPLDVNNNLCSETGLPQDSKNNLLSDPNYIPPVYDISTCPLQNVVSDIIENNNGNCDGYISFKVITNKSVTITFTNDFKSIASYAAGISVPPGYELITIDQFVTTNVDKGYICGISATKLPNGATGFTSRIIITIKDTATSVELYRKEFSRNHTNQVC